MLTPTGAVQLSEKLFASVANLASGLANELISLPVRGPAGIITPSL
jgi:hypothetical protein